MPLPGSLTTSGIVLAQKAVQTVVQSSLVDSVRNGVVDFLSKQVQDLGNKELADCTRADRHIVLVFAV